MIGGHFLKGWSRTQNHVTMSSAEAELVAMVKCSAELMGVRSLMLDWGDDSSGVIYADSSAALAIANEREQGSSAISTSPPCGFRSDKIPRSLSTAKSLGRKIPRT